MAQRLRFKPVYLILLLPVVFWIMVSRSTAPKHIGLTDKTVAQWNTAVEKTITEPQRAAKLVAYKLLDACVMEEAQAVVSVHPLRESCD